MYVCTYVCEIYVHKGTWKLHKMQHTKNIRSAISVRVAGKTRSKMWKFLIRSIALSTWILNEAILLFSTNSLCVNCSAPLRKGGIFKLLNYSGPRYSKHAFIVANEGNPV